MGRAPCCSKVGLHRGPWTAREDALLIKYIEAHGEGQWRSLPKKAGLLRCGKSCRLRWMNYLRPDIKRGNITPDEDDLIIRMHGLLGNRWSLIAGRLPGRTDNEIKNYWNTHLSKKLRSQGTDPNTHKKLPEFDPDDHKLVSKKIKCSKSSTNRSVSSQSLENKKQVVMMMKDDIIMKEDVKKTKIHLPKPVRVTNVIPLTRNNSNGSIETSVSTTSASSSQSQYQNHGLTFGSENSNNNILDMPMPWLSSSDHDANNMLDENGFDHLMMMASCGDHHDVDQVTAPEDQNQQLEQLYEEYLQLIKADHHHGHNDHDDGDGDHLDSFAESFLI